jgi:hypothetical protein
VIDLARSFRKVETWEGEKYDSSCGKLQSILDDATYSDLEKLVILTHSWVTLLQERGERMWSFHAQFSAVSLEYFSRVPSDVFNAASITVTRPKIQINQSLPIRSIQPGSVVRVDYFGTPVRGKVSAVGKPWDGDEAIAVLTFRLLNDLDVESTQMSMVKLPSDSTVFVESIPAPEGA